MSIDGKSKLIRLLSVFGDLLLAFLSVAVSFALMGAEIYMNKIAIGYGMAISAAVIFNYVMLDLYSLKAENIYNALISTGIGVIIAYFMVYVLSRILRVEQQNIVFWLYLFAILLPSELVWRMIVAITKKKTGKKRSMLIIENMENTSRLARKL